MDPLQKTFEYLSNGRWGILNFSFTAIGYLHVVLRFTSSIPLENAYHFYQLAWSSWGKRLASLGFLVAL